MNRDRIQKLLILFGLPDSFSEQQLKQAYRDLVQVWHPDRHVGNQRLQRKSNEKLKEINAGEKILSDLLVNGRFDFAHWMPAGTDGSPAPRTSPTSDGQSWTPEESTAAGKPARAARPIAWRFVAFGAVIVAVLVGLATSRRPAPIAVAGAAAPAVSAPLIKSPRLDDRNGFKQFSFGLSTAQAEAIEKPDRKSPDEQGSQRVLTYNHGPVTKLGDYPLDKVELKFFRDQLYRIEIFFSRNQDKLFQSFTEAFGDSNANGAGIRNGRALRARFWQGENVLGTILAEKTTPEATGWDTVVLSDLRLTALATAFAQEELKSAFGPDGFKGLTFGMSVADTRRHFNLNQLKPVNEAGIDETSLSISNRADPQQVCIGLFPLDEIRCHFFRDQLYRIDLAFSGNGDEFFQAFTARFPQAKPDSSWQRGQSELLARQWTETGFGAAILAQKAASPQWDRVILFQPEINNVRRKFQEEAPTRAAKDI